MTIFESLTTDEIAKKIIDPEIEEQLDFDVEMILAENAPGSAYKTFKKLEPALRQSKINSDLLLKYDQYLVQLKFIALPKLTQDEAFALISTNLLYILKQGYDLNHRIYLYFSFQYSKDFKTVDWLLRSFETNNELLVNNVTFADGKQYAGTAGNLIRLYKNSPDFSKGGAIGISNFLSKDKNVKQFSSDKIELLRQVLSIYDWIRLKALHNNEEDNFDTEGDAGSFSTPSIPVSAPTVDISRPVPTPVVPKLTSEPNSSFEKEKTAFEKRLAEISVGVDQSHGMDLEVLKHRVEDATSVKPINMDEIRREVATPELPASKPNLNNPVNTEIKREVATAELPAHIAPKVTPKSVPPPVKLMPAVLRPVIVPKAVPAAPRPAMRPTSPDVSNFKPAAKSVVSTAAAGSDLKDIKTMDDLKKINLSHLRQGPIQGQIQEIKSKILTLAQTNHVLPYYAVLSFEQSPLFQTYVASGNSKMENGELSGGMTHQEFEAVADLKKQVER